MTSLAPGLLPVARLGTTDMYISRVGLGAWGFGGPNWSYTIGVQDDDVSIKTIRHCFDVGVNWLDTAPVYGLGHSEYVVGRALREMPADSRPYIFTKCGCVFDENDRSVPQTMSGRPESIRREVEASLRRLGVERIDLYQMHHVPDDGSLLEDYWLTMLDLKREGKVRAVGLSNHDTAKLLQAEKSGHVDTLQMHFSAITRGLAERELPQCLAQNTGMLVFSPMQSGLLSGRFTPEKRQGLTHDIRAFFPDFNGDTLTRNLALAEAMRPIAERHGVSVAAVAVAWTLAWPGVSGAIVGARSPEQVDDWVAAGSLELQPQDLLDIRAAIVRTKVGAGPTIPAHLAPDDDLEADDDADADILKRRRYNSVISSSHGSMIVNLNDTGTAKDIVAGGAGNERDADLIRLAIAHLRTHKNRVTCLDIGANVGLGSLMMAQAAGSRGRVIAFEAQRLVYYMLAGNVAMNSFENIWCRHNAVGAACGEIEAPQFDYGQPINLSKVEFGDQQREDIGQLRQFRRSRREMVSMVTIDSLKIRDVGLMKIDVEGMDLDVLTGAETTIETYKPFIIANYAKTNVQELLGFLTKKHYKVFADEAHRIVYCSHKETPFSFPDLPSVVLPS